MSTRYKVIDQNGLHFLTLTVVDWVDIFTRRSYKEIILDNLRFYRKNRDMRIGGYVIMSNHLHLILQVNAPYLLTDTLRDFKKYTAKQILEAIQKGGYESRREWLMHRFTYRGRTNIGTRKHQFWQSDNHPVYLYSPRMVAQKLNYIHRNPVDAGWVDVPSHYLYSSASNYFEGKGRLAIDLIEV